MATDFMKIFLPSAMAFLFGIAITPSLTDFLYAHKMWKKKVKDVTIDGKKAEIFHELHKDKEVGTPRMGGIVIWASVAITTLVFYLIPLFIDSQIAEKLNFLSRNQTWLPLFTLLTASFVGLLDDYLEVSEKGGYLAGGLSLKVRIVTVLSIGLIGGWWFFAKLGVNSIGAPFLGEIFTGPLLVIIFAIVMLAIYSGGIIDGIDGLSGGVMATAFGAYAGIAFFQNQIDIATFCVVVVGGILAFLWFNIPPARFYMTETGIMGLTTTLTVVAFLTDAVFPLIIIAFPLIATSASAIIQLLWKKWFGRKLFKIAPLHHHFEAIGWPGYKVAMRYWVISTVLAIIGMVSALL